MTNIILPFLMSMILGRTIDLTTYDIRGSVYDDADYDEITVPSMNSTYHVLQEDVFPYSFFGLPADIVLRIKSNFLSASSGSMGLDGLLKDTSWKYNSVIMGVTTIRRTVNRSLKKDAKPIDGWRKKIKSTQTHYAETLYYGGWCVTLFKFKCDIPGDVNAVRKTLTETFGHAGELNDDTIALWDKAIKAISENKDIRGQVKISTLLYSSVPLKKEVSNPKTLTEALKDMPEIIGSLGHPLFMNMHPLHDLDESYPEVKENENALSDLEKLDKMLDDVKATKVNLMRWITDTQTVFTDEDEERIYTLLNKINNCIRAFSRVTGDVSLFKDMDRDQLELAFHTYLSRLERGMGTYNLAYMKLREEIDAECEDKFLHKIRGLLKVYDNEKIKKGHVKEGLEECQKLCTANDRCRAIGYADHISELDLSTGQYFREEKQCWIYFRSTSTATVYTPNGLSGDMAIYDRNCYVK